MSEEVDLYAMMTIATEHQAAVKRAAKALEQVRPVLVEAANIFVQARKDHEAEFQRAAQVFAQAQADLRAEIQRATGVAIREAVAAECVALASPLKLAAEKAEKAAASTQAAAKAVKWLWLTGAVLVGIGLGWGGHWYLVTDDLKALRDYAAATYEQTKPPEKAKPK
jgi:hypothetical protein